MTTKSATKKKAAAAISADSALLFRVDIRNVRDLARRIRKALCDDVMEFPCEDNARDLTRFLAVVEALAGVLEIELRMTDFMEQSRSTASR